MPAACHRLVPFPPAPSDRPDVASAPHFLRHHVSPGARLPPQGESGRVSRRSQRDRAGVLLPRPRAQLGTRPPCSPVIPEAPPNLDAAQRFEPLLPPGCTLLPTSVHGASDCRTRPSPRLAGRFAPGPRSSCFTTALGRRASWRGRRGPSPCGVTGAKSSREGAHRPSVLRGSEAFSVNLFCSEKYLHELFSLKKNVSFE